ncbi:MAG: NAD(+) diphosphatase [Jiangellaceae bacterium]|nr:NAD(+) diphosphatase [Jiangellaceae bacterium]
MDEPAPPRYSLRGPLALSRTGIDRAGHLRSAEDWLESAWKDPRSRAFVVADGAVAVLDEALLLGAPGDLPEGERFFLGLDDDGTAFFAVHVAGSHPDARAVGLRQAALRLGDRDVGLMVHAVALANWHENHRHCSRCGEPTTVALAGHVRRCRADGSEHFPRTDPAVIVLVSDGDDRCLLGRQARWPAGWYSTLAGFVEPGESPEQAVAREVAEETGVAVVSCAYAGSQPWPFPSSLMLGYYAIGDGVEPRPDGAEISEARWYSRAELLDAVGAGEVLLPPAISISRRLIEGWYGAELHSRPR